MRAALPHLLTSLMRGWYKRWGRADTKSRFYWMDGYWVDSPPSL